MSAARTIWKTGWRVVVCVLLLAWVFQLIFLKEARSAVLKQGREWEQLSRGERWMAAWQQGPSELWNTLSLIPASTFALSVGLMGVTVLLGMMRWRTVLRAQGLELSAGRATEISLVAHFFNSFLLGSTGGDLMKAFYAARETHHKKTEAVVTVFVDRLLGLWAMLLFAGLMMAPNFRLMFEHERLRAIGGLILAMLGGCTGLVFVAFWGGISRRWGGARAWLRRLPKGEWLERSLNSCRQFGRSPWFISRTLAISMVVNSFCVLQVMVLARGLNLQLAPITLFVIVPVIIFLSAMPITPSGLGVRENLYVFMLATPALGVPATAALSLSLLTYAGSLFWSVVGGVVYLTFRERHHLADVEHEVEETGRELSGT